MPDLCAFPSAAPAYAGDRASWRFEPGPFAEWPTSALGRRLHGSAQRPGTRTRVLAWFAAACALAFWGGLAAVAPRVAQEMPLLLTIGSPGAARPLFAVPWVAAALVVCGAISWLAEAPAARASRFARSYAALVLIAAASAVTLRFVYAL